MSADVQIHERTNIRASFALAIGAVVMSAIVTYFTAEATIDARVTKVESRIESIVQRLEQSNVNLAESIDLLRDELRQYYQRRVP